MIFELLTVMAPVITCAFIGFCWAKRGLAFDVNQVTTLVTYFGTPCLVFATLTSVGIDQEAFRTMALGTAVTVTLFGIVGFVILRIVGMNLQTYLPPLVWSNMGNMGLPLCLFAFGQEGLALGITYFAVNVVMFFSLGVMLVSGSFSITKVLQLPFVYAVLSALFFMTTDYTVPVWIHNTTELIGGLTIPLMLIMLGVSLVRLKITSLKRAIALSTLRLTMGFMVGVAVAEVLGLEGVARGVLIVQSSMPVAVYNYLFAVRYNRSPEEIAGIIVISTVMSFATLPILLWYVI